MIIHEATVNPDGTLQYDLPGILRRELRPLSGCRVKVKISATKGKRSLNQNEYYFGVVVQAFQEIFNNAGCNFNKDETHDILRTKFLYITEPYPRIVSTTELTTTEFNDYITQIQEWAAREFDVYIPDPKENG